VSTLSPNQVAFEALQAGFDPQSAVTDVAVSLAEDNSGDPAALGDTTIEDATWGPSVGLLQIRSLKAQESTGATRDEQANTDPLHNQRAALEISSGGTDFTPWSTFDSGAFQTYLSTARAAVANPQAPPQNIALQDQLTGSVAGVASAAPTATNASLNANPFDLFGVPSTIASGATHLIGEVVFGGIFLAAALAMVVLGVSRLSGSEPGVHSSKAIVGALGGGA
jgi:hypothetical protein